MSEKSEWESPDFYYRVSFHRRGGDFFFFVSHKTQMRVQIEEKLTCVWKRDMFQRYLVGQLL